MLARQVFLLLEPLCQQCDGFFPGDRVFQTTCPSLASDSSPPDPYLLSSYRHEPPASGLFKKFYLFIFGSTGV
jgi:hypothetical protein